MRDSRVVTTSIKRPLRPKKAENQQQQAPVETIVQPTNLPGYMLGLQRHYGNRFVQRVVNLSHEGEASVKLEVEQPIQTARGGGQALDSGVRAPLESALKVDFSGALVHSDGQADNLNHSLSPRAFITGQDIFFKQGKYSSGSSTGRKLLSHDLAHMVQQNGTQVQTKLTAGAPGDKYEQEAEIVARAVMQQEQQTVQRRGEDQHMQWQAEEAFDETSMQAKFENRQVQRQVKGGTGEEKTSEAEKSEQRFKLFVQNLYPKKPESNWEKFSSGMDKLLLTLGHEKAISDLSSKLKLNPKGRLLLNLVTKTGASIWLIQKGKIPNVIPEIPLADNLTLDVKVGGTPKKLDLMINLKLKF